MTFSSQPAAPGKTHAVTGAFGFSGKYIAARLLAAGHNVVTLTNSPNRPNPFAGKVAARPLAFDDPARLAESLRGVEVLYNTYWVRFNHPLFSHADAVRNTIALFAAAREAGVERIVHVSIANADPASPLAYFRGKGQLEQALQASGLSHAIVRPAVLFGPEDILINNIAWSLRRLPVFCVFGDGLYHMQPVHVDDMAALMVNLGATRENVLINAVGPEDFTYRELARMIGKAIGCPRPILGIPPGLGYLAVVLLGKLVGDVFATKEEIAGLMGDNLHAPGAAPTGQTRLSDWVKEHGATIGRRYHSELARRARRDSAYQSAQ